MIIDADNRPDWVIGYFRAFREWQINEAPKKLTQEDGNYIELFGKHIGIEYDVIANPSEDQTRFQSFTFKWKSEQDRTFFILKF